MFSSTLRTAGLLAILAFIAVPMRSAAELKAMSPMQACGFMNDHGLPTRAWRDSLGINEFACSSSYRELGSGLLSNNLAYYVEGDKLSVKSLKLVLNVNNREQANSGLQILLSAAEALSQRVAGAKLPQSLSRALLDAKKTSTRIGNVVVEVLRADWPTGKGFEVHVAFR